MGIQGLLPQLKSIMAPIHVEELKGQTVAVDTYSWLHKGALSCSAHLCKGLPTSKHIGYCMHRVNLLRYHGVRPLLVFDGGLLPIKMDQETKRARMRKENLERAMEHEAAGNSTAAFECYQKAVDISPSIAFELIRVLKQEKVDFIVAPYEADAQMTFLSVNKLVDAVITEDSDLIPFGCSRIIFKMDKFGQGVEYQSSKLGQNKELDLFGFTKQMVLEMCIFSGCDYLQSLPGMGLRRAHGLIRKLKSYEKVIKHLRYNSVSVPPLYEENFKKAMLAFQHQRVYDPAKGDIAHLSDIPEGLCEDLDFLGPWLPQNVAKGIAEGNLDPITKMPFEGKEACGGASLLDETYSIKESKPSSGRKRLDLPVQKNVLTNYFCLASLQAKRKFRAPKVMPKQSITLESFSLSSESEYSDSPGSTEDVAVNDKEGLLFTSGTVGSDLPSEDSVSIVSELLGMEEKVPKESRKPMGSPLDGAAHEISKPALASPKKFGCDSAIDDATEGNGTLANRKVIGKSRYFRHKMIDQHDHRNMNKVPLINKENNDTFGSIHQRSIIKRRKLNDVQDMHNETLQLMNCQTTMAISEEGSDIANRDSGTDMKAERKFGCDISHLKTYTGIAEKSMEKFASLISSFRYSSSGSRASGLRAPLKDVQNSCAVRSAVGGDDLSKFSYASKNKRP
ncbi:exonuclease 1 isoform X1 [Typha angustifolia]|uniref:exonuclease 1 isoform X1 n=1 Tax=Typha angustifolia TaxID=59011 RepID=UPI003C2DCC98